MTMEHRRVSPDIIAATERELRGDNRLRLPTRGVQFKSELPGVSHISLLRAPDEKAKWLFAIIFYEVDGKSRHETFTFTEDGQVRGRIPKALKEFGVEREDLAKEIQRNLELLPVDFWHELDTELIPQGEEPLMPEVEQERTKGEGASEEKVVDLQRIAAIVKQGALFGAVGKAGLQGYHAFVFEYHIVLENPIVENALYIVQIPEGVVVPEAGASREERDAFFQDPRIRAILTQTKQEMRANNAVRIIHTGDWESRLRNVVGGGKEKVAASA